MLEAELVRRPQLPAEASRGGPWRHRAAWPPPRSCRRSTTTCWPRLERLDEDRAEIVRRLEQLRTAASIEERAPAPSEKRSSASLKGARVRWVGA